MLTTELRPLPKADCPALLGLWFKLPNGLFVRVRRCRKLRGFVATAYRSKPGWLGFDERDYPGAGVIGAYPNPRAAVMAAEMMMRMAERDNPKTLCTGDDIDRVRRERVAPRPAPTDARDGGKVVTP